MPMERENSSVMTVSNSASGEASVSSGHEAPPPPPPVKKKRNLPGMPDPDAEVIALSPTTLMATNRFVCEICSKGFQRDQNLQLHRRGHNLPWKLRQRTGKEVRKRVYVCPEPSCVHHDPSRALGDLTGIKKHFCRKHGEKKWKCDKCSKKYAVQSDWKAHSKTCGTREYRCDCGTLFSRRDSFITHRAFCDALAEESAKAHTTTTSTVANSSRSEEDDGKAAVVMTAAAAAAPCSVSLVPAELPIQSMPPPESEEPENSAAGMLQYMPPPPPPLTVNTSNGSGTTSTSSGSGSGSTATLFTSLFSSATASAPAPSTNFTELIGSMNRPEPPSLCLSANAPNLSIFSPPPPAAHQFAAPPSPPSAHMSATALLQKAAQMGAAATTSSFLRGFGLATSSSSSSGNNNNNNHEHYHQDGGGLSWGHHHHQKLEHEPPMLSAGLGLGLAYENGSGLPDLMMGSSSLFGPKPATLDLLGLGIGPGVSATGGLSALMTSIGSGLDVGPGVSQGTSWEGADRKSSSSAIL